MKSAFTSPILVPSEGQVLTLERAPLTGSGTSGAYSEDWLQDLLYRFPGALPVSDIDDSYAGMVPLCREMQTQDGRIDVFYVTPNGRPVIVEAKLWRNPQARREVIGQILDYAKNLANWDFDKLDAAVRAARRSEDKGEPKGLLEVMGFRADSEEATRFHDSLTRCLQRGELLLLIVGDGIREDVGAITRFLDQGSTLHFTFGLLEMAVHRIPGGGHFVQPRILAQSMIFKRIVIDLRNPSIEAHEGSGADDEEESEAKASPETIEAHRRAQAFWSGYLGKLSLDDRSQEVPQPARGANQYFKMPGGSQAWLSAFLAPSQHRAGVYLTFAKGPIGDQLYAGLLADKDAIERALEVPVEWKSDGSKHWIMSSKRYSGSLVDDHADAIQTVMADWTNRYVNVFRPRLETLTKET